MFVLSIRFCFLASYPVGALHFSFKPSCLTMPYVQWTWMETSHFFYSVCAKNETLTCASFRLQSSDCCRQILSAKTQWWKKATTTEKTPSVSVSYLSSRLHEATLKHHQGQQSSSPHSSYSHSCHVENVTGALYRSRTHVHTSTPFTETPSSHW